MFKFRSELLSMVRERSYEKREITLSSGLKSDFYIDMKNTLLHPYGIYWVSSWMSEKLKIYDGVLKGVGGLTMGADPLATALSMGTRNWSCPVMAFYIRKEPKGHGTSQWIEGLKNLSSGDSVFILEDVVTSGGSSLKAVQRAKEAGLNVRGVLTCVDRQEGGESRIREHGLEFLTLLTKQEIVGV